MSRSCRKSEPPNEGDALAMARSGAGWRANQRSEPGMSKPIQSDLARIDALITRCETLAERSPSIYRLRVGLLAYLGIAAVPAVVVGSVLISVALILAIAGASIAVGEIVNYGASLIGLDSHGHRYVHIVGGGVALLPLLFANFVLKD